MSLSVIFFKLRLTKLVKTVGPNKNIIILGLGFCKHLWMIQPHFYLVCSLSATTKLWLSDAFIYTSGMGSTPPK